MKRLALSALLAAVLYHAAAAQGIGPGPVGMPPGPQNSYNVTGMYDLRAYGAKGDTQRWACTVTTTANSTTATISGTHCSFTTADIGKNITIAYAGTPLTTSPVASLAVGTPGSYSAVPTLATANGGSGAGFIGHVDLSLQTAPVLVSGGSGCTNGAQTFTVDGTTGTAPTITGTVTAGALSGTLTISGAGDITAVPATINGDTVSGGGCATAPTIDLTNAFGLLSATVDASGFNYAAGTTITVSSGAGTVTPTMATPVAQTFASKITGVSGSTLTFADPVPTALTAQSEQVVWGTDDHDAIQKCWNDAAAKGADCNMGAPAGGYYYGVASSLTQPEAAYYRIHGFVNRPAGIVALAPMAQLLYRSDTKFASGVNGPIYSIIEDVTFDGNKLATNVANLVCPQNNEYYRVWFKNAAPYSSGVVVLGQGDVNACTSTRFMDSEIWNDITFYSGASDLPLVGANIYLTDSYWNASVVLNNQDKGVWVQSTAFDTRMDHPHVWNSTPGGGGVRARYIFYLEAKSTLTQPVADGFSIASIYMGANFENVVGGYLINPLLTSSVGVEMASGKDGRVLVGYNMNSLTGTTAIQWDSAPGNNDYAMLNPGAGNGGGTFQHTCNVPFENGVQQTDTFRCGQGALASVSTGTTNTAFGYNAGHVISSNSNSTFFGSGAGASATGGSNTLIGASAGKNLSSGQTSTYVGSGAGSTGASAITGSANTAIGYRAGYAMAGTSNSNTMLGGLAGSTVTTGAHNTLLGSSVGSTTLTTGARNVLIGTDSNCAVDASGTNDQFKLCASSGSTPLMSGSLASGSLGLTLNGTLTAGSLGATPGGKQPLCIDTGTGRIYAGSGGAC